MAHLRELQLPIPSVLSGEPSEEEVTLAKNLERELAFNAVSIKFHNSYLTRSHSRCDYY